MKSQLKISLQIAWLAAAVSLLLMGTNICVSTDAACHQAGESMFFMMFWLSFPTGLLMVVPAAIVLGHESIHSPSDFITGWIVLACGGLLQWFLLVPRFLQKPELTFLKLGISERSSPGLCDNAPSSSEVIEPAPVLKPAVPEIPAPVQSKADQVAGSQTRPRRKSIKRVAAFDRTGRSPLERVINSL